MGRKEKNGKKKGGKEKKRKLKLVRFHQRQTLEICYGEENSAKKN